MDEERIKNISEYNRPHTLTTIRRFHGLVNSFKKIISELSEEELPLINNKR